MSFSLILTKAHKHSVISEKATSKSGNRSDAAQEMRGPSTINTITDDSSKYISHNEIGQAWDLFEATHPCNNSTLLSLRKGHYNYTAKLHTIMVQATMA